MSSWQTYNCEFHTVTRSPGACCSQGGLSSLCACKRTPHDWGLLVSFIMKNYVAGVMKNDIAQVDCWYLLKLPTNILIYKIKI